MDLPPLWRCPRCHERFVTRNLWHSCGKYTLADLFCRSEPHVLKLFKTFAAMVRACGPVHMIPQKTRVVFQVRVRFAGAVPRKTHLLANFALPYRADDSRFVRIDKYAPHFQAHTFRVESENDLDEHVQAWLRDSYEVGAQTLLMTRSATEPSLFRKRRSR
jgi:hypothetical protein